MKYVMLFVALVLFIKINQAQGTLKHYERKAQFSCIMLPNQAFKSSDFKFIYPDSIYNTAEIQIKKARFENLKRIKVVIKTKDKTYSSIQLSTKSNKRFELLKEMLAKQLGCSTDEMERGTYQNKYFSIAKRKLKRNKILLLTQKK